MNNNEWHVTEKEAGERLDKILVNLIKNISRHQIQRMIKNKQVFVNGIIKHANYRCQLDDHITWKVVIKDETLQIRAENIPLPIIYEDEFLIVINKPQGMLVHPTKTKKLGTLVNALKFYTNQLSTIDGEERPGIVHRLDQDTSGVMVIAKDNKTHENLKKQFQNRSAKRIYEAIVLNGLKHDQGMIKAPIGRDPKNRLKMGVVDKGKEAKTHYQVLQRFDSMTHVQCKLITGRTHQIRVHMKYIQHPIIGDKLYNKKKLKNIDHQALYAKQLCFHHPYTNEWQCYSVEAPPEFVKLLTDLNNLA